MFGPWTLTDGHGIEVIRVPLHGLSGCTDGRRIWLDTHLTDTEVRCALTHKLVHISRGHERHQTPASEASVRAATARLLIPWDAITVHIGSQLDEWHLAQELGVTIHVLADRLQYASIEELRALRAAAAHPEAC
ncbi:ImmA/IrrE family metallo-endopeptidase [Kocuria marina]|uniref:ImmA/IrrE family metallo-endopeptidase n=1 Tax=Kocuria marina TaxID=223184 RepID=UPI000BF09CF7